jgi:hypothetical protein
MLKMVDLGWAAGFLEGEGWFGEGASPKIGAGQKERQPLERLQALFGGKIILRKARGGFTKADLHFWYLDTHRSPGVMMTLYSLMSDRRQAKIREVLFAWRNARNLRPRNATHCFEGHELSPDNVYVTRAGHTQCKTCKKLRKRERRERIRASQRPRISLGSIDQPLWSE